MQGMLIKEEIEITNCSKERHAVLEEYRFEQGFDFLFFLKFKFEGMLENKIERKRIIRERVLERKMELERLEKMIFQSRPRDDFDCSRGRGQGAKDASKDEVARLEETFAKLRGATGVSRTEDILNRFLGQRATKDNLQKMRVATEREKTELEKQRQRLVDEMETRKFSEARNAEQ